MKRPIKIELIIAGNDKLPFHLGQAIFLYMEKENACESREGFSYMALGIHGPSEIVCKILCILFWKRVVAFIIFSKVFRTYKPSS